VKTLKILLLTASALTAGQVAAQDESAKGHDVFQHWCAACHKPISEYVSSVPGTTALENKYQGAKPAALEQRTDLTPDLVKGVVRNGVMSMPPFRKTEISDAELNALSQYLARAKR
jgi:mono/diheme cytochrome c family protein